MTIAQTIFDSCDGYESIQEYIESNDIEKPKMDFISDHEVLYVFSDGSSIHLEDFPMGEFLNVVEEV